MTVEAGPAGRGPADGAPPATPDELFAFLAGLGIGVETHAHAPVFTVEEARHLRGRIPGGHCKSLLLEGKRGELVLLVCDEDRRVDLKRLARDLGVGRFSFASPATLWRTLGVTPGSVTPFALINDRPAAGHEPRVQVVLDRRMMTEDVLNYHPLDNRMTTSIGRGDLGKFIEATGHPLHICDLDAPDR